MFPFLRFRSRQDEVGAGTVPPPAVLHLCCLMLNLSVVIFLTGTPGGARGSGTPWPPSVGCSVRTRGGRGLPTLEPPHSDKCSFFSFLLLLLKLLSTDILQRVGVEMSHKKYVMQIFFPVCKYISMWPLVRVTPLHKHLFSASSFLDGSLVTFSEVLVQTPVRTEVCSI